MSNRFHNNPPLRYGMIGGGITSRIGDSHRAALRRDSYFQLVAGAFDIDKKRDHDKNWIDVARLMADAAGKVSFKTDAGIELSNDVEKLSNDSA